MDESAQLCRDMRAVLDEIIYLANTERDRLEEIMQKEQFPDTFEFKVVCIALKACVERGRELV